MLQLLKRLFGNLNGTTGTSDASQCDFMRASCPIEPSYSATDLYFSKSSCLQNAVVRGDFERAGILVRESLQYIEGFVIETCHSHGSFDVRKIPPLEQGGRILALVGDEEALFQLEALVEAIPELEPWRTKIQEHWEDFRLFNQIEKSVLEHPYCLQTEVKSLVGYDDGHRIATLISYLEKAHRIQRITEGKRYRLVSFDSAQGPPWAPHLSQKSDTKVPTNAELIVSAERWNTDNEIAKGRISIEGSGCWLWKGTLNSGGYGRITRTIESRKYNAPVHQLTWLEHNGGVWPPGAIARHLCRNRACCRPDHITPGTPLENVQDAQFRDGTMDVSIHRLPPHLRERLIREGSVEWNGQIYDLL